MTVKPIPLGPSSRTNATFKPALSSNIAAIYLTVSFLRRVNSSGVVGANAVSPSLEGTSQ
jgi:hypothetical protein